MWIEFDLLGYRRRTRCHLDLRCDPAALRPGSEDGDLCRSGRVDYWNPPAEHVASCMLAHLFTEPPHAVHNAGRLCRGRRRDHCRSIALQGILTAAVRRRPRPPTIWKNRAGEGCIRLTAGLSQPRRSGWLGIRARSARTRRASFASLFPIRCSPIPLPLPVLLQ